MKIKYEIEFLDYWHLSSGLSGGAKLDSIVVKDKNNLPFISGKTIKGLTKEMAYELGDSNFVDRCFGKEGTKAGECFFSNATIKDDIKKQIIDNDLAENLYDVVASTSIGKNSIAEDNSLREIEVVVPLTLSGEIDGLPSEFEEQMMDSLSLIKRVGLNRNRGLGRCQFKVEAIA
jgi:hypothetical protein